MPETIVQGPERPAGARRPVDGFTPGALSVLVVDDDLDAGASLGELLALFGHRVRVEHSGEAALAAAAAEPPEVLICDLGLPDLDGLQIIRRIRAGPLTGAIFAVALTGYAGPTDREEALRAGFDAHLVKPQDIDAIQRVLALARAAPRAARG